MEEIFNEYLKFIKLFPNLQQDAEDLLEWATSEIEDGASVDNEKYLFEASLNNLIKNYSLSNEE
tara:strand:- start:392 stop:583 length:192 start_codon:yes stop_codon:yes gene_type:complete